MTQSNPMRELLACPRCKGALRSKDDALACKACAIDFPVLDEIPVLFESPREMFYFWKQCYLYLFRHFDQVIQSLERELSGSIDSELTRKRLTLMRDANTEQKALMQKLLKPLLARMPAGTDSRPDLGRAPNGQPEFTACYYTLHQDWGWDTGESAAALESVSDVLEDGAQLGRVLVLGAGSCRLPFDLHLKYKPELTAVMDRNLVPFLAAKKIVTGSEVELYEFPLVPRELNSYAVKTKLVSRFVGQVSNFHFFLADARALPIKNASFDTVFTPWFIDVVDQSFDELLSTLSNILKPQGRWINFGPVGFKNAQAALQYSKEEVLEKVEKAGFQVTQATHEVVPYFQSPLSCHGRLERVLTFNAIKK
ncbi:MAG: methyltransferase domain-containing protein [Bdellovibrionota bacterium]